jgi:hypothetical protein
MNSTEITAAVLFSRNCLRGADRAAARVQHRMAAELRASAQRVVREANASVAHLREVTPAAERAGAFAATISTVFGQVH